MSNRGVRELVGNLCKCFLAASIIFSGLAIAAGIFGNHQVSKQALIIPMALLAITAIVLLVHNVLRFIDWADKGYPRKGEE